MRESWVVPPAVKVGPLRYTISFAPDVGHRGAWGECNSGLRTIELDTSIPPQQAPVTLLHELMHAVWQVYGRHDDTPELEERVIGDLAMGLAQVLQDIGWWPTELREVTHGDNS